jgi:hypothetical protein
VKEIKLEKTFGPYTFTIMRAHREGNMLARINFAADNEMGFVQTPFGLAETGMHEENVSAMADGMIWLRDSMFKLKTIGEAERVAAEALSVGFDWFAEEACNNPRRCFSKRKVRA